MYQLTYRSIMEDDISSGFLKEILKEARVNNSKNNITGCLVCYDNTIVQILEGDEKRIKKLFKKIGKDPRHHSVELIWEGFCDKRHFTNWNMACYSMLDETCEHDSEKDFKMNMILFAKLSEKSSSTLISFWSSVQRLLVQKRYA